MKPIIKVCILFMVSVLIATLIYTGPAMAQMCPAPEQCTATGMVGKTSTPISISIQPDGNGKWPILINNPETLPPFRCDDPDAPNSANYPCLVWAYRCNSNCSNINKVHYLIPKCCDNPINILWTSHKLLSSDVSLCTDSSYVFPGYCSAYDLLLPNNSGNNPGLSGWFATPADVGTSEIDIRVSISNTAYSCLYGITGPSCNTTAPPVRVESRTQCWQFTADTDNCHRATTWYAEWMETDPCAVNVWAARAPNIDDPPVLCEDVKTKGKLLTGESLGAISIYVESTDFTGYQPLTESLVNNAKCSEGWLRFTNPTTGCNVQCFTSGGRRYCY